MTKNQKIALGCGGAGCLGLIVVVIAAALIGFFRARTTYRAGRDYTFNVNLNNNSNLNSNSNDNSANSNSSSSDSGSTDSSSLSEDDKHKLFQAAAVTGDGELVNRVQVKIGILNDDFTPGEKYHQFLSDHIAWATKNYQFMQTINTPEKARAYVNSHFPE